MRPAQGGFVDIPQLAGHGGAGPVSDDDVNFYPRDFVHLEGHTGQSRGKFGRYAVPNAIGAHPIADFAGVGADTIVQASAAQHAGFCQVKDAIYEVQAQIEVAAPAPDAFQFAFQRLRFVGRPGQPAAQMFDAAVNRLFKLGRVLRLPAAEYQARREHAVGRTHRTRLSGPRLRRGKSAGQDSSTTTSATPAPLASEEGFGSYARSCRDALPATMNVTQIPYRAMLLPVKRGWPSSIESWRIALCTFFLTIALILKFFAKFSLRNIGLVMVVVMLLALSYSVYRIFEGRKSQRT